MTIECPRCNGTGIYAHMGTCYRCNGRKIVNAPRARKAKAPAPKLTAEQEFSRAIERNGLECGARVIWRDVHGVWPQESRIRALGILSDNHWEP